MKNSVNNPNQIPTSILPASGKDAFLSEHEKERHWLAQNSPYRPHILKKQQFSQNRCCGEPLKPAGLEGYGRHPETGREYWFPVYQCRVCGKHYLWLDGKGKPVDSLLSYEVRRQQSK